MEEVLGPERSGGQGLDCHQEESGNRVILALLQDPEVRDHAARSPGRRAVARAASVRGAGIRAGLYDSAPRHVDIAPTICHLMGFPTIDGADYTGRTASERGVPADVYLKRQDGRVLDAIVADGTRPGRVQPVSICGVRCMDRPPEVSAPIRGSRPAQLPPYWSST